MEFKNKILLITFFFLAAFSTMHAERVVLDAADFGVRADGESNDALAIQRMIDAAVERGQDKSVTFRFPADSRIYAEPYRNRHLFRIDGFHDLRIEGSDTIFSLHPDLRFIFATNCDTLTVRGINIEMAVNPTLEATIMSTNRDGSELTVRLDEPERAPTLAGPTGEDGEQGLFGMLWLNDLYTDYSYHYYVRDFETDDASVNALTTVIGRNPVPAHYFERIRPGETRISLPVAGVAHRHGPGAMIIIDRCGDVHFEDVEVWSAPWFAYQIFRNTGELVFRRAHVRPQPGSKRVTSIWRDAFHVKGNSGTLLFEDCILKGMNDDAFNVSTHNWRVTRVLSENHFEIEQFFPIQFMPFQVGGNLEVLSADGQVRLGNARIERIKGIPEDIAVISEEDPLEHPEAPTLEVITAEPIAGIEVGSVMWDTTTANPSVTIRGCVIRNSCRFQSPVTLENNDIQALVWFYGEDVEGPLPSGSIVRNNTFKRGRGNPEIAVSILGVMRVGFEAEETIIPSSKEAFPLRDIVFENNRVYGDLVIDRVHGLQLRGNRFPDGLGSSRIAESFDVSLRRNRPNLRQILQNY